MERRRAIFVEPLTGNAIEAICIGMVPVVGKLVAHVQRNQQATGNTNRQPKDVNACITRVLAQVAERDFEIVFDHSYKLLAVSFQLEKERNGQPSEADS
jgi:hypothetical protein